MKKAILGALFAGAMLASCSSDEPVIDNGGDDQGGEARYLTVNIVTTPTANGRSRAAGVQTSGDPNGATYEEGLENENKVEKVRFYFFASDGTPANVKKAPNGSYINYYDWTNNISEEDSNIPDIEKVISATIVINTKEGDASAPAYMVAVVNGTREAAVQYNLTDGSTNCLYDVANDYVAPANDNKFTMSNAAYKDADKQVRAVSVEGHVFKTPGEATSKPVEIYVEREVAKVRLESSISANEKGYYPTFTADKPQKVKINGVEKDIYVNFLGWNTTAVTNKTRVVKKINPGWAEKLLGANIPWNWTDYHRSFWAINADGVSYQYGKFNVADESNPFTANAIDKFDKSKWAYINENAAGTTEGLEPGTPTKVIIAAQLVDADGNPLTFAQYGATKCEVSALTTTIANNCGLYKKVTDEDKNTHMVKLEPSDLKIVTATSLGKADASKAGRYKVYFQLSATGEAANWYPSNADGQTTPLTKAKVNETLVNLGSAKVWNEGYTYYYFDIKHLGGKNGVVRNHIYDTTLTLLTGLGTPVYDPDEVIYPEKPKDDTDTYIAARINILSWRVVSNNNQHLEW